MQFRNINQMTSRTLQDEAISFLRKDDMVEEVLLQDLVYKTPHDLAPYKEANGLIHGGSVESIYDLKPVLIWYNPVGYGDETEDNSYLIVESDYIESLISWFGYGFTHHDICCWAGSEYTLVQSNHGSSSQDLDVVPESDLKDMRYNTSSLLSTVHGAIQMRNELFNRLFLMKKNREALEIPEIDYSDLTRFSEGVVNKFDSGNYFEASVFIDPTHPEQVI
jgi:hypothetical protein